MIRKDLYLAAFLLLILTTQAAAQKHLRTSKVRISASALAGSKSGYEDDFVDPGFGMGADVGLEYVFHKFSSVAGSYSYFFTGSDVVKSFSVINGDFRYYFPSERRDDKIYALLGIAVVLSNRAGTGSESETGINIGAGYNHAFNKDWGLNFQVKYMTPGESQLVLGLGIIKSL